MKTQTHFDTIIRSGKVLVSQPLNPSETTFRHCDIGITNGKIVSLESGLVPDTKTTVWEAKGFTILPGLIDSQVHFRDPGMPEKEDFGTGTKGAVLGGITAVFDMPNTKPNTSTPQRFKEKCESVAPKAFCDFGLFAGATNENSAQLKEIEAIEGCCGIKIFMGSSTGDLLVSEDQFLRQTLLNSTRAVSVHCEDEARLLARKEIANQIAHPKAHPEWRDVESALLATQRIVRIAKETGRRVHILHVTTEEELDFLKDNKDIASVEILPQHMYFSSPSCYEDLGTFAQMNPPIRDERHQKAIREALKKGWVDVIASDHAPHTREEKNKIYPNSPSGLTGVQTLVPIMLNFVNQGLLDLHSLALRMSINPARLFKAKGKGGIYIGQDADFTIVDMNQKHTFTNEEMATRCGWTPYAGHTVQGFPVATWIRGHLVMERGKVLGTPAGRPISFAN